MAAHISDLIVHVDESLETEELHRLEDYVRTDACVISACASHEDPHILLVTFNPQCTSSRNILNLVTSKGLHAELVGL